MAPSEVRADYAGNLRTVLVYVTTGDQLPIASCLIEAVWALRLPGAIYNVSREIFTLDVR
jgi:hypothetical protein